MFGVQVEILMTKMQSRRAACIFDSVRMMTREN